MADLKPTTKLSRALELHPDVLPYIISLNPHDFERLNAPLMRQVMPPRITLERLAVMVGLPVGELISGIYAAAGLRVGEPAGAPPTTESTTLPANPSAPPAWFTTDVAATIDLLEADERLDTDPFVPIFPALRQIEVGEIILLKHKWEPQPLYDVWQKLGVEYYAVQQAADEWWIYLRKGRASYRGR